MKLDKNMFKVITINDKDKEIKYTSVFKLILGCVAVLVVFPLIFLLLSIFNLLVCTYEASKAFIDEFKDTAEYTGWKAGFKLIYRNIKSVLTYKKKRVNK